MKLSLRPGTRRSYSSLEKQYLLFCATHDRDSSAPISEKDLCRASVWFVRTHSLSSLKNFLAAIRHYHIHSFPGFTELPKNHLFASVQRGLRMLYGSLDAPNRRGLSHSRTSTGSALLSTATRSQAHASGAPSPSLSSVS